MTCRSCSLLPPSGALGSELGSSGLDASTLPYMVRHSTGPKSNFLKTGMVYLNRKIIQNLKSKRYVKI